MNGKMQYCKCLPSEGYELKKDNAKDPKRRKLIQRRLIHSCEKEEIARM